MGNRTWWRLARLMALVYAVQGAWWPLLAVHLRGMGISGRGRGAIFATQAIASLLTPLWIGQLADRRIAAPKLLAGIYGLGSILMMLLASNLFTSATSLFVIFLLYWIITAPAVALSNAVCMRNLEHPAEQFGGVRLWGTAGWMLAGWLVGGCLAMQGHGLPRWGTSITFAASAACSLALMVTCFSLPPTPPLAKESRGRIVSEAREVIRRPGVATVLTVAFGVSLTTPFINQGVPAYLESMGLARSNIAIAMTFGQVCEILGLMALPFVLRGLGPRFTMALGILAWVVYHAIYASGPPSILAIAAIGLNGPAITFFHVAGPMYLDSQAPARNRAGMQSLWLVATTGLGNSYGNFFAGEVIEQAHGAWRAVFLMPTMIAAAFLVGFLIVFRAAAAPRTDCASVSDALRESELVP